MKISDFIFNIFFNNKIADNEARMYFEEEPDVASNEE